RPRLLTAAHRARRLPGAGRSGGRWLRGADLRCADPEHAELRGAGRHAELRDTGRQRAELRSAQLGRAQLRVADVGLALLGPALFAGVARLRLARTGLAGRQLRVVAAAV